MQAPGARSVDPRSARERDPQSKLQRYRERYWREALRQMATTPTPDDGVPTRVPVQRIRRLVDEIPWLEKFLARQGITLTPVERARGLELRSGARRLSWRPARDFLHVTRGGTNAEEARRYNNEDLAEFRRRADHLDGDGMSDERSRAYLEWFSLNQAGYHERDAAARDVKLRRKRWLRASATAKRRAP